MLNWSGFVAVIATWWDKFRALPVWVQLAAAGVAIFIIGGLLL